LSEVVQKNVKKTMFGYRSESNGFTRGKCTRLHAGNSWSNYDNKSSPTFVTIWLTGR